MGKKKTTSKSRWSHDSKAPQIEDDLKTKTISKMKMTSQMKTAKKMNKIKNKDELR